jgi:hypothetical protein
MICSSVKRLGFTRLSVLEGISNRPTPVHDGMALVIKGKNRIDPSCQGQTSESRHKAGEFLRKFFDTQVKRLLYRLSYMRPLDLRDLKGSVDPMEEVSVTGRRWCIIEVPLTHCRTSLGFPFTPASLQPFVRTVRSYVNGQASSYSESPLKEYYEHFQPKNIWELLDLSGEPHPDLLKFPPWAYVRPWEKTSLAKKLHARITARTRDNISRGADLSFEHGGTGFGPVSMQKGQLEFRVLARLSESIQRRGYIRNNRPDGDVTAIPLVNERGEVRYVIRSGKHRTAVLTALGFERIPLRISFLGKSRAAEADHWPHVKDGLFTPEQAATLFQRLFEGRPPRNALPPSWLAGGTSQLVAF